MLKKVTQSMSVEYLIILESIQPIQHLQEILVCDSSRSGMNMGVLVVRYTRILTVHGQPQMLQLARQNIPETAVS